MFRRKFAMAQEVKVFHGRSVQDGCGSFQASEPSVQLNPGLMFFHLDLRHLETKVSEKPIETQ